MIHYYFGEGLITGKREDSVIDVRNINFHNAFFHLIHDSLSCNNEVDNRKPDKD